MVVTVSASYRDRPNSLVDALGCTKINFIALIEPVFLYGMCIGHTRSHAKFQTSGLKDLAWPPLFVNGS